MKSYLRDLAGQHLLRKLLVLSALTYSSSLYADTPPNADHNLLLTLALSLSLLLGICALYLIKRFRVLKKKEQQLNDHYQALKRETIEKNDKLYQINQQLYEEIAKHEETEELLIETRNYLQSIINSMPSILVGVTREGIVTHWNSAAQSKTGITYLEALGNSFKDFIDEPSIKIQSIKNAIDKQKPKHLEAIQEGQGHNAQYKDITIYPISNMELESAVIRIDDVTTRVQLENMIIQNEKMSSLGELAAGLAHEINNPLGTILQSIQNIQRRLSDQLEGNITTANQLGMDMQQLDNYLEQRKVNDFLENIKAAGERAAAIVTNMLEFSGSTSAKHEPVQLIPLINRSIDLAISSSSLSKEYDHISFNIVRELPDSCPMIYGAAGELQQVILNIINNAYQAYSDHFLNQAIEDNAQEGALEIHVKLLVNTRDVAIVIDDNGPGMDEWTQRHIFEPFFSTKEASQGTGLGLSVSYFIITEHHRGSIQVHSELNRGTTFTIRLPTIHH